MKILGIIFLSAIVIISEDVAAADLNFGILDTQLPGRIADIPRQVQQQQIQQMQQQLQVLQQIEALKAAKAQAEIAEVQARQFAEQEQARRSAPSPIPAIVSPPSKNINSNSIAAPLTSEARIILHDGWEPALITDKLKANGTVLHSYNKTIGAGVLLGSYRRAGITDMETYAKTVSAGIVNILQDGVQSMVMPLTINGVAAWQIEISGKMTERVPVNDIPVGTPVTVLFTVFGGSKEIVRLTSWTLAANFPNQKEEFRRIANSLTGLGAETAAEIKTGSASNTPYSDVSSKLTILKSLLDKGLITKADYETKKQKILNSM